MTKLKSKRDEEIEFQIWNAQVDIYNRFYKAAFDSGDDPLQCAALLIKEMRKLRDELALYKELSGRRN